MYLGNLSLTAPLMNIGRRVVGSKAKPTSNGHLTFTNKCAVDELPDRTADLLHHPEHRISHFRYLPLACIAFRKTNGTRSQLFGLSLPLYPDLNHCRTQLLYPFRYDKLPPFADQPDGHARRLDNPRGPVLLHNHERQGAHDFESFAGFLR